MKEVYVLFYYFKKFYLEFVVNVFKQFLILDLEDYVNLILVCKSIYNVDLLKLNEKIFWKVYKNFKKNNFLILRINLYLFVFSFQNFFLNIVDVIGI